MFGISYNTWQEICKMYFSLNVGTQKAYLQWFPFSKLTDEHKVVISSEEFYGCYIKTGGFALFPEVMLCSDNYIQKSDGGFRDASLVSPLLFLVLQAIGKEISLRYENKRPRDIAVYYGGNYKHSRPTYKKDYDDFYKEINSDAEQYRYFIKTDISSFYGNINVNELIEKINKACNNKAQILSQTQLLLIRELLLYCGEGHYPLIESSMASSYLATVIYLDEVDCELYEFINTKVNDIISFQMIRYVDDLYILFSANKDIEELTQIYNTVKNTYSSILKKHGLMLNTRKCVLKEISEIKEELKKSQYDEYVNGIEFDLGEFFSGTLKRFLTKVYENISRNGLTNEQYSQLIDECFKFDDIEFTSEEVFNYLVYENQTELKKPEVSDLLIRIIKSDLSFLTIDPKRLTVMVMQSGNDSIVRAMLNQLFIRYRANVWNSYDTTIAITYLIQSKFQHIDLLKILYEKCSDLYRYYYFGCRTSFICQIHNAKWNCYLRCIENDQKAAFLFFMSLCEQKRANYLIAYAYYKNFFDRISADMIFLVGTDTKCEKPNYKAYYKDKDLIKMYKEIPDSDDIIRKAHKLRNENPLSHSSAGLIDSNSSSAELMDIQGKLDKLIFQYATLKKL